MKKHYVTNSSESPRIFSNNILEAVSKVHFTVPLVIYLPVVAYFTYKSFWGAGIGWLLFIVVFATGIFLWSLTEYFIHRFIFHFMPTSAWGRRLHFIFHGVHHDFPKDAKRLVMPPSVSIPLAFCFYWFYGLFVQPPFLYALFAGVLTGYLVYDMMHYAIHHLHLKNRFWKKIQRHHAIHHYADETRGFGVSSALWDKIFNTDFKKGGRSTKKHELTGEDFYNFLH